MANGKALNVRSKEQHNRDYFYTVTAVDEAGSTSGVYTAVPGETPIRCCIVTVLNPVNPFNPFGDTDPKPAERIDLKLGESLNYRVTTIGTDDPPIVTAANPKAIKIV